MGNCTKGTKGGDPAESMAVGERQYQSTLESDYRGPTELGNSTMSFPNSQENSPNANLLGS